MRQFSYVVRCDSLSAVNYQFYIELVLMAKGGHSLLKAEGQFHSIVPLLFDANNSSFHIEKLPIIVSTRNIVRTREKYNCTYAETLSQPR